MSWAAQLPAGNGSARSRRVLRMVRAVGLEPTLLSEPDFESGASTSFTTPARHEASWRSLSPMTAGARFFAAPPPCRFENATSGASCNDGAAHAPCDGGIRAWRRPSRPSPSCLRTHTLPYDGRSYRRSSSTVRPLASARRATSRAQPRAPDDARHAGWPAPSPVQRTEGNTPISSQVWS